MAERTTLDSQLVDYWLREAARLDVLSGQARFGFQRRRYARKAAKAREQAERSRTREDARRHPAGSTPEFSQG